MPPVKWAEIQSSLDENLFESRGLISPGTKYFRKALQDYFDLSGECEKLTRCRLVRFFTGNEGLEQARVLLEESTPFLPHVFRPNSFFTAFPPEANS